MTWICPLDIALYLLAGAALGALYFVLLARSLRLFAEAGGALRMVPFYLLRLGVAVAAFWLIAQQGAQPLLLALAGFLVARLVAQHWMRPA